MNQLPLEDVLVAAQMSSPHSSGIVTMREAPLDQLASLAQQALAIVPRYPLPVGVDGLLFILLSDPVPFARLLLFGNVSPNAGFFHPHQCRAAVISLVAHHLYDAFQVHAGLRFGRFPREQASGNANREPL